MLMMGRSAAGNTVEIKVDEDGTVAVSASVTLDASSLATAAKQDAQTTKLTSIEGRLPAALTGGGGIKVGCVDALPAGTAEIGKVGQGAAATASAPWPTQPVGGGAALFPNAAALSSTTANPTTTLVGACAMGYDSNTSQWKRLECDSSRRQIVQTVAPTMAVTSRTSGTAYEAQRGVNFSYAPAAVRVFLSPSYVNATLGGSIAYILFVNKGSAAANADAPYGADVFPISAGTSEQIDISGISESMASGCQVVISDTPHQVTLPGTAWGRFTILGN